MQVLPNNDSSQPEDIEIAQQPQLATKVLIKRCSKCHIFSKLVQSFPPSPFDSWCDECLVNTPLIKRTRRCSVNQFKRLMDKKESEAQERANLVALSQTQKKALADERAKNKKNAPTKFRKKTVEGAYTLALDFGELSADVEEEKARDAILAHDARRAYISRAQDKTIFDEDYYGEYDNN